MFSFPGRNIAKAMTERASCVSHKSRCVLLLQIMARCSPCGIWYHKKCRNISELVFKKKAAFVCKSVVVKILFFDFLSITITIILFNNNHFALFIVLIKI